MGIGRKITRKAVFLDRDGVINPNVWNEAAKAFESPHRVEDFRLNPGAAQAMRDLQKAGYALIVVTNQPSYAKNKKTPLEAITAINDRLRFDLAQEGVSLKAVFTCLHHPESTLPGYGVCACRKPSPYFLLQAERWFGIDLHASWMVGDRATDIACAQGAGVKAIQVSGQGEAGADPRPLAHVQDLTQAAALILQSA
ncbi:MAG: HAD-IIIA family hydrolase [Alphaproteobacteria bacterium]|nr:HAD-IIIA family hydrolase [Alphaproteobacteria bacterium]